MYNAIVQFLSVPENARSVTTSALSVFVVLATTGLILANPTILSGVLGAAVMCAALILGRVK
jgi:hypothetical protein